MILKEPLATAPDGLGGVGSGSQFGRPVIPSH